MDISVIVPVYNVEKYLPKCIDSILAQTFTNFELLLINDGSKDSSGTICDEYAAKDSRIRVFHKENGGVSAARNLGLDNAKGEWIAFVDSDDWVLPGYFDPLDNVEDEINIVKFGVLKEIKNQSLLINSVCESGVYPITHYFKHPYYTSCCYSFFYRNTSHFKSIRFSENIRYSEDREFIFKAIIAQETYLECANSYNYIYKYIPTSAVNIERKASAVEDDLIVLSNLKQYLKGSEATGKSGIYNYLEPLFLNSYISAFFQCSKQNRKHLNKDRFKLLFNDVRCSFSENYIKYLLFLYFPSVIEFVWSFKKQIRHLTRR